MDILHAVATTPYLLFCVYMKTDPSSKSLGLDSPQAFFFFFFFSRGVGLFYFPQQVNNATYKKAKIIFTLAGL